jgi:hypothetical protein
MRSIVRHDGVRVVLSAQPVGRSYVRICWGSAQQNVQQFVQQKLLRAFESIVFADKFIALERFTRSIAFRQTAGGRFDKKLERLF